MQQSIASDSGMTISALLEKQRRENRMKAIILYIVALGATLLLVLGGLRFGFSNILGIFVVLGVILLISRWPIVGFFIVACSALLIDQEPLVLNGTPINLYVFYWPTRLTGLVERPIGFLLLYILFVVICQRFVGRQRLLQGGKLLFPLLLLLLCVVVGVVRGMTSGGTFKIIVLEVRPFLYLFEAYLLAYNLVSHRKHIQAFLWMIIACAGLKALVGIYIYLAVFHGSMVGHNELMAHEESFFFVALILLVILFYLHHRYRPQLYVALLVLPFILIALVLNQRRADYLALLMGLLVAWVLVIIVKPRARKALLIALLIFATLAAGYVLAFGNAGGTLAEPARAIISFYHPDPRDAASNLYRVIENFDLQYTARQNPLLGWGFGKPFLQPIALPNILQLDPYYLYIPHNTIYWIWMRLGVPGYAALWFLIGSIIVYGCIIARRLKDPYLQLIAIYIVAITVMEVLVAYADYQLFFYRNVIYLGLLAGILMKLPVLDKGKEQSAHEYTGSDRRITASDIGSKHP